ncbi:hypothetical protein [Promicromonospora sp. MEB111]|uniref:hypothetical protein n=1 Tax=unclassified Promicromonospora TaxID=2647929 RepID=UPI00254DD54C|nr:hypothetical protein [Promicromonospora sp. MEB111]
MTLDQVLAIVWGVGAIAIGLHAALNSEANARAALKQQGSDPDESKFQWMYPLTRTLGWILVPFGFAAAVLGLLGL